MKTDKYTQVLSGEKEPELSIQHWYNYAYVDSFYKLKKFQGQTVFQPIGYETFGQPTEEYAGKTSKMIQENLKSFILYIPQQYQSPLIREAFNTKLDPTLYNPVILKMYLLFTSQPPQDMWNASEYRACWKFRNRLYDWFGRSEPEAEGVLGIEFFKKRIYTFLEEGDVRKIVTEWMTILNENKHIQLTSEQADELAEFFLVCF